MNATDVWVMATGSVCAMACAILGTFLVLRRQSLLGDAISHAILPGLVVAFMWSQSKEPMAMMAGALGMGVLTAGLSSALSRWGRLPGDTAMGVVFSSLFALGVILITFVAGNVDLDPGCVLYGALEMVTLDRVEVMGVEMPRAFVTLMVVLMLNVVVVAALFKEMRIASFDAGLATTMGISATVIGGVLMTLVAGTCVASFEAVGSVLVVAMLVGPAATAYLLTDRLGVMVVLAMGIGVVSAVTGYVAALKFDVNVAGAMSVMAGVLFAGAVVASPRHGVMVKMARRVELMLRIAREDLLAEGYRALERRETGGAGVVSAVAVRAATGGSSRWVMGIARWMLVREGMLEKDGSCVTQKGKARAAELVRGHRLWEAYLHEHTGLPLDHLHEPSHRVEHFLSTEMRENLARQLEREKDPHGRKIPEK